MRQRQRQRWEREGAVGALTDPRVGPREVDYHELDIEEDGDQDGSAQKVVWTEVGHGERVAETERGRQREAVGVRGS